MKKLLFASALTALVLVSQSRTASAGQVVFIKTLLGTQPVNGATGSVTFPMNVSPFHISCTFETLIKGVGACQYIVPSGATVFQGIGTATYYSEDGTIHTGTASIAPNAQPTQPIELK